MTYNLSNVNLTYIMALLTAVGGLGTAAYSLVDNTKALKGGGISKFGFEYVEKAVKSLIPSDVNPNQKEKVVQPGLTNRHLAEEKGTSDKPDEATTQEDDNPREVVIPTHYHAPKDEVKSLQVKGYPQEDKLFGTKDIIKTLKANWLNGVAKADQKAAAKSFVRLGLTVANVHNLAEKTGVKEDLLKQAVDAVAAGTPLTPENINILGEFDMIVSAILDEGYERADQSYRNCAKLAAAVVAIGLALIGGWMISHDDTPNIKPNCCFFSYWGSSLMWWALIIGVISTPLAPIAKDLSSALSVAVKAVGSVKR